MFLFHSICNIQNILDTERLPHLVLNYEQEEQARFSNILALKQIHPFAICMRVVVGLALLVLHLNLFDKRCGIKRGGIETDGIR